FDLSNLAGTEVVLEEEPIELVEDKGSVEKGVSATKDKDSTAKTVTTASVNLDDFTLAKTLMAIRSSASRPQKLKGVLFKEPSEPTTITTSRPQPQIPAKDKGKGIMQEPKKLVKVKGKDQIEYDADVAQRLQAELQAEEREQVSVEEQARLLMEFIAARNKFFAAKRDEEQRNKPPTKAKQRKKMCTYMKHMAGYKDKKFKVMERKLKAVERKQLVRKEKVKSLLGEESVKRQKVEDDAEKAELKACLEIVLGDDSAVNVESLATKYLIVNWKTHILA
ncbi:hypothetical protein Tco_0397245, partial [Tanacetum coccineum]